MNLDIILNWRKHPNFEAITMQEEVTKKGRPHYQGALLLNDRVSWASLKTWAQKNIGKGKCSVCCKEGPYDKEKDIFYKVDDPDKQEVTISSTSPIFYNDAGTLYSNMLYAVKIIYKYTSKNVLGEYNTEDGKGFKFALFCIYDSKVVPFVIRF